MTTQPDVDLGSLREKVDGSRTNPLDAPTGATPMTRGPQDNDTDQGSQNTMSPKERERSGPEADRSEGER